MSEFILEYKNVTKIFGNKEALNNVSFALRPGTIAGLLGPNGSGKTTLIKIANGLLVPDKGEALIDSIPPCAATKEIVSYLPDCDYLNGGMSAGELTELFKTFYKNFEPETAKKMLDNLGINPKEKLRKLSKGTREKVRLIMVMSRRAKLYLLDEPIGGVDPAARDYIISGIINNYSEDASVLISTHLIADVEKILDEAIFIKDGEIMMRENVDDLREREGKSVDAVFREVFKC